jgi:hypothetical protein
VISDTPPLVFPVQTLWLIGPIGLRSDLQTRDVVVKVEGEVLMYR